MSKFHRDRVHRARLHIDRSFHLLVTLQRLFTWRLGLELSVEALAHELTTRRCEFSLYLKIFYIIHTYVYTQLFYYLYIYIYIFFTNTLCFSFLGMAKMKENKGKEVVDEVARPRAQSQTRPSTGDKRKSLPKTLDFGNLPNRRGKKAKHGLSKPKIAKSIPPSQPSIQMVDIDSSVLANSLAKTIVPPSSMTTAPTSSQPS